MKIYRGAVYCLLWVAVAGCARNKEYPLPVTKMQIGGESFGIEIAVAFKDQETGLMHRDHLDADHGMIFVSDQTQVQRFWNHEVHFPLDLVFLDEKGKIVSLKRMKPYDDATVPSDAPAKYTIELLGGTAERLNLKVGDHVALPDEVVHPATIVSH
jgi:uncharacterized membrane protein (UPF0127 family)